MPKTMPLARLLGQYQHLTEQRNDLLDKLAHHARLGEYADAKETLLRLEGLDIAIEQLRALDVTFQTGQPV